MKYTTLLPFVAAATKAFVIPDEVVAQELALNPEETHSEGSWWDSIPSLDDVRSSFEDVRSSVEDTYSSAVDAFDGADSALDFLPEINLEIPDFLTKPWDRPGKGRKGHHGHHGHHKPNLTIYQAIKASKYSTKFAKLVDEYPDIVQALNSTKHNITAFVPTDKAFEKIPHHDKKPPKEFIEKVLQYHLVPGFYSAKRILFTHTLPTSLKEEALGDNPQRLRVSVGLLGVRINFYSKIRVANLFTTNGVIHAVDSILIPPPPAPKVLSLFPQKFSTLILAGERSGLADELHKKLHNVNTTGGTVFAPTNWAFKKLGIRANAFLFNTEKGRGYLKALLKYHIVLNETLYSDAYYGKKGEEDVETAGGHYHIDLPTLLEEKNLSIDVARWAGFITIKINGFTRVSVPDVVTKGGSIHVVDSIIIPPHEHKHDAYVDGDEIEVEDLMERLEPFLETEESSFNEL